MSEQAVGTCGTCAFFVHDYPSVGDCQVTTDASTRRSIVDGCDYWLAREEGAMGGRPFYEIDSRFARSRTQFARLARREEKDLPSRHRFSNQGKQRWRGEQNR